MTRGSVMREGSVHSYGWDERERFLFWREFLRANTGEGGALAVLREGEGDAGT